jgi:acyl transferase domain-containing protein
MTNHHIAIVGMGCNYPGAPNVAAMWDQVREGRSAIREVGADRWDVDRYFDLHPRAVDKTYSKHMAALDNITSFAPEFYGITPKRARVMDPQQRVFLECARVALEDAGYATRSLPKETTGVYAGISTSDHRDMSITRVRVNQMLDGVFGRALNVTDDMRQELVSRVPAIHAYTMIGQLLNMNAANISQAFDLGGPVFTVDTACSSALVALQQAVLHLRLGITDAALVGGAFISLDPAMFVCFSRIGALSRSGACMPFEQRADGFVLGEGAGVVVLKRLEDAQRDADRVWAVIEGLAVNNDARGEGPMTPSK